MKTLEEIDAALAELRKAAPPREDGSPAIYPRLVTGIEYPDPEGMLNAISFKRVECGAWVKIRVVDSDKTHLGVYLGDFTSGFGGAFTKDHKLALHWSMGNPAIYVPDLKRIVRGYESWWGVVETPDDLKEITDADINDVWYVRALKDLSAKDILDDPAEA